MASATKAQAEARQREFVREYLISFNGAEAARKVGYAAKNANRTAYDLLQKPDVQEWLKEGIAARAKRTEITADRVIAEIAKVGFASLRNFLSIDSEGQPVISLTDTPHDDLDALAEVSTETVLEGGTPDEDGAKPDVVRKTKIKMHDKLKALNMLAVHTGALKEPEVEAANILVKALQEIGRKGSASPVARDTGDAA